MPLFSSTLSQSPLRAEADNILVNIRSILNQLYFGFLVYIKRRKVDGLGYSVNMCTSMGKIPRKISMTYVYKKYDMKYSWHMYMLITFSDCKVSFHILLYKIIIANNSVALLFMYIIQCALYEDNNIGCWLRVNKEAGKRWKLKIALRTVSTWIHVSKQDYTCKYGKSRTCICLW